MVISDRKFSTIVLRRRPLHVEGDGAWIAHHDLLRLGDLDHARHDEPHVARRLQRAVERILERRGIDRPAARELHARPDLQHDRRAVALEGPGFGEAALELVGEGARQALGALDRPHLPRDDRVVEVALHGIAADRLEDVRVEAVDVGVPGDGQRRAGLRPRRQARPSRPAPARRLPTKVSGMCADPP